MLELEANIMRKTILAAAAIACLTASFAPAPIEAAQTSGTVVKQDPSGDYVPCSCVCVPWLGGKQLCICICG